MRATTAELCEETKRYTLINLLHVIILNRHLIEQSRTEVKDTPTEKPIPVPVEYERAPSIEDFLNAIDSFVNFRIIQN